MLQNKIEKQTKQKRFFFFFFLNWITENLFKIFLLFWTKTKGGGGGGGRKKEWVDAFVCVCVWRERESVCWGWGGGGGGIGLSLLTSAGQLAVATAFTCPLQCLLGSLIRRQAQAGGKYTTQIKTTITTSTATPLFCHAK